MRLSITGTPEEVVEKSDLLIQRLSDLFRPWAPDLSENLEKALPRKEHELKYPVLRYLLGEVTEEYDKQMGLMIKDIGKVLDRSVQKSLDKAFQDHTTPIADADAEKYEQIKIELIAMGWQESDFEKGGPLYGWSTNQLIDLARGQKNKDGSK